MAVRYLSCFALLVTTFGTKDDAAACAPGSGCDGQAVLDANSFLQLIMESDVPLNASGADEVTALGTNSGAKSPLRRKKAEWKARREAPRSAATGMSAAATGRGTHVEVHDEASIQVGTLHWVHKEAAAVAGASHVNDACIAQHQQMIGDDVLMTTYDGTTEIEKDASCCNQCQLNAECTFWVRVTDSNLCFLKTNFSAFESNSVCRSAFKVSTTATTTTTSQACIAYYQEMSGDVVLETTYTGATDVEKDTSCCNQCQLNAQCTYWVRATDSNSCWLGRNFRGYADWPLRRSAWKVNTTATTTTTSQPVTATTTMTGTTASITGTVTGTTTATMTGTVTGTTTATITGTVTGTQTATTDASDQSSVVGDPHIVNVAHERFEIRAQGVHKIVQIPRFIPANEKKPDLRVDAKIEHLASRDCSKSFMTTLSILGQWTEDAFGVLRITQGSDMPNTTLLVNTQGPEEYFRRFPHTDFEARRASITFKLRDVSFHVAKHFEGRYGKQQAYLNLRVTGLKKYKDVGGLLGHDDHAEAEKLAANCTAAPPAADASPSFIGTGRSVPVTDGGSRIEAE